MRSCGLAVFKPIFFRLLVFWSFTTFSTFSTFSTVSTHSTSSSQSSISSILTNLYPLVFSSLISSGRYE